MTSWLHDMKTTVLLAITLLSCVSCFATPQHADLLCFRGKTYQVYGWPLVEYYGNCSNTDAAVAAAIAPEPLLRSSACVEGYWAKWEIRNHKLVLTKLFTYRNDRDIPLWKLFPGASNGVVASWYSGTMRCPWVLSKHYDTAPLWWKVFHFRNGKYVGTTIWPGHDRFAYVIVFPIAIIPIVVAFLIVRWNKRRSQPGQ